MQATIHTIKQRRGIAGQLEVVAVVQYPDEPRRTVTFVGSTYGGPVLMRSGNVETFVTDAGRFGSFGVDWAREFFT